MLRKECRHSIKKTVSDSSALRRNHKPTMFMMLFLEPMWHFCVAFPPPPFFPPLTDSLPRSSMTQRRSTCFPTSTETLSFELRARSMRGCTMCCCVKRASDDAADPGHRTPRAPSPEAEAEDEMRRLLWSWWPP